MPAITLLFPHQLFTDHPALHKDRAVWLVEEPLFFTYLPFHLQKIVLHRASMKAYAKDLEQKGYKVHYVETLEKKADLRELLNWLASKKTDKIHYADTHDCWIEQRLSRTAATLGLQLISYPSPAFLNTMQGVKEYFDKRKTYFQTDFYINQRKSKKWLLKNDKEPLGDKWTFDTENRKPYPKGKTPPTAYPVQPNEYVKEAIKYANKYFSAHPGFTDRFCYPVTRQEALHQLDLFLKQRLSEFGAYEDAMQEKEVWLHHSVLSPALNIGLITPDEILQKATQYGLSKNIPLASLEGFGRQIMGWREFIRIVYEREGVRQRTRNFWNFSRKIPSSFWSGTTGIRPVDVLIDRLQQYAYTHHIERLMVLGNFMLLCEFDPDQVYEWFMVFFIDSYDWVMVPNVYGMTQFADGGIMTTKPYISGSNYLLKMGDWDKKTTLTLPNNETVSWTAVWDGLFWRFMHTHRDFFSKNPRLGMLLKTWDKMDQAKKATHLRLASLFLEQLDSTK
ncbi:MAG: cryptochrome/photolyase family protein [Chitinophagia bacterium]|nr:cryptochrome/photolyase family protein [Chitinophagia bacterium]